jgi:hypothetical protein
MISTTNSYKIVMRLGYPSILHGLLFPGMEPFPDMSSRPLLVMLILDGLQLLESKLKEILILVICRILGRESLQAIKIVCEG